MGLDKIAVGVKTFLRDPQSFNTIAAIKDTLPETKMIIADDGEMTDEKDGVYSDLVKEGHKVIICPFDSGFGYKSNRIVEALDREFLLVGADDFDFRPPEVRGGIEKMLSVLENTPFDIASGRVNNRPYEFDLVDNGDTIKEVPVALREELGGYTPFYYQVDLTINYSLVRRRVFEKVRWWDDIKIGNSEHAAFFLMCKRASFRTAFCPNVNINEQQLESTSRYRQYRARANNPERLCMDRLGIRKYTLGNGIIDYEKQD